MEQRKSGSSSEPPAYETSAHAAFLNQEQRPVQKPNKRGLKPGDWVIVNHHPSAAGHIGIVKEVREFMDPKQDDQVMLDLGHGQGCGKSSPARNVRLLK